LTLTLTLTLTLSLSVPIQFHIHIGPVAQHTQRDLIASGALDLASQIHDGAHCAIVDLEDHIAGAQSGACSGRALTRAEHEHAVSRAEILCESLVERRELGTRNGAHADRGGVREHVERPRPGAVAAEYAESVNGVAEDPEVAHTVGEDAHPSRIPSEEAHAPGRGAVQPAQAHGGRWTERVAITDDERTN